MAYLSQRRDNAKASLVVARSKSKLYLPSKIAIASPNRVISKIAMITKVTSATHWVSRYRPVGRLVPANLSSTSSETSAAIAISNSRQAA